MRINLAVLLLKLHFYFFAIIPKTPNKVLLELLSIYEKPYFQKITANFKTPKYLLLFQPIPLTLFPLYK